MNIAVPALFVFLLVLPGIVLRYAYLKGSFASSPFRVGSFADEFSYGVFWALVLHILWGYAVIRLGFGIDYRSATMLLLGNYGKDQVGFSTALNALTNRPERVAGYFVGLNAVAGAFGYLSHVAVRWFRLDRKFRPLRFANDWYYLMRGEVLQFRDRDDWTDDKIFQVWVSAVLEQGEKTFLYKGLVQAFYFDKEGQLDRVILSDAMRRELAQDRKPGEVRKVPYDDERYYNIEGQSFVLKYSEIETLNFEYILFRLAPDDAQDEVLVETTETAASTIPKPKGAIRALLLFIAGYLFGRSRR